MKDQFISLLSQVERPGIDRLTSFLENSDFYTAPCSTKFHLSVPGGLVRHSMNVYKLLTLKDKQYKLGTDPQSLLICGLLHDICKVNFYGTDFRNVKNPDTGQWERKQIYIVEDQFPMGHGEKSVIMLQQYLNLTVEEQLAIRWHMGPFTDGFDSYSLSQAYYAATKASKLVTVLFTADMEAAHIFEA